MRCCAQAIEAQEPEAEIRGRTRTASSITYQTLFKYYPKLAGMTVRIARACTCFSTCDLRCTLPSQCSASAVLSLIGV